MGIRDDDQATRRIGPRADQHEQVQERIQKMPEPPTWRPLLGDVAPPEIKREPIKQDPPARGVRTIAIAAAMLMSAGAAQAECSATRCENVNLTMDPIAGGSCTMFTVDGMGDTLLATVPVGNTSDAILLAGITGVPINFNMPPGLTVNQCGRGSGNPAGFARLVVGVQLISGFVKK